MNRSVDTGLTLRAALLGAAAAVSPSSAAKAPAAHTRVPVIDITDLYHPYQDPGDNFDLIAAYALPEIDLRAVILDPTEGFRAEVATAGDGSKHGGGPRDAGIIPVMQLNYLFDRNVAWGIGPFLALKSPVDKALDAPGVSADRHRVDTGDPAGLPRARANPVLRLGANSGGGV